MWCSIKIIIDMAEKPTPEIKQPRQKNVQRINVKAPQQGGNSMDLISVLNRIANALEEKNLREEKIFKLEEKLKKFELMEARENYKALTENKKQQ